MCLKSIMKKHYPDIQEWSPGFFVKVEGKEVIHLSKATVCDGVLGEGANLLPSIREEDGYV